MNIQSLSFRIDDLQDHQLFCCKVTINQNAPNE